MLPFHPVRPDEVLVEKYSPERAAFAGQAALLPAQAHGAMSTPQEIDEVLNRSRFSAH
jgi:hypothetical protein